MNRTSCSLCSWITEQKTYLGLISNSGCRKKLRREKGKYGIKKHDLDLTPSHEHCCGLTEKRSVCSYLWNLLLVKSLIRKAASQVVSAGNELVSSEVLEFVGIVVFFIIQLSTSVALLSPPPDWFLRSLLSPLAFHQEHILASPIGPELSNCLSFKINNLLP